MQMTDRLRLLLALLAILMVWPTCSCAFTKKAAQSIKPDSTLQLRRFDKEKVENFKQARQFQYEQAPYYGNNLLENILREIIQKLNSFFSNKTQRDVFLYTALGIILIFVALQILKVHPVSLFVKNKKTQPFYYGKAEGPFSENNLLQAKNRAVASNDYRNALRYLFSLALLKMDEYGHITYKPHKTVQDYLLELQDPKKQQYLRRLATHFEYGWYGNFTVTPETFQQMEKELYNEMPLQAQ